MCNLSRTLRPNIWCNRGGQDQAEGATVAQWYKHQHDSSWSEINTDKTIDTNV